MNEKNNIITLINEVAFKYQLTQMQVQNLTTRYHNDTRNINVLRNELETVSDFFHHQNKLASTIANTPPLEPGKNYYVTAFDANSNIFLQPVSINITNPETSEVLVDNSFKAMQKHTSVDDIEIAICQIGKLLGFNIVEEYKLYNANKQQDSIIIRDSINDNEFYDVENLKKRFAKLIHSGKLKKEEWFDISENLKVANSKEDYKLIIDYGLNVLKSLPSILEEDYNKIEEQYFNMLLFDSIIGQSERDFKDYGILCDKVTKRYSYAPLFDNVFPSILKNNDVISINGITCNRYELMECLVYNYYDKIKVSLEKILANSDRYIKNIDVILKYNVNVNNYNMIMNNIVTNLNYLAKLTKEKSIVKANPNAGYVNIVQLVIGLGIIMTFSILIGYLIYAVK